VLNVGTASHSRSCASAWVADAVSVCSNTSGSSDRSAPPSMAMVGVSGATTVLAVTVAAGGNRSAEVAARPHGRMFPTVGSSRVGCLLSATNWQLHADSRGNPVTQHDAVTWFVSEGWSSAGPNRWRRQAVVLKNPVAHGQFTLVFLCPRLHSNCGTHETASIILRPWGYPAEAYMVLPREACVRRERRAAREGRTAAPSSCFLLWCDALRAHACMS